MSTLEIVISTVAACVWISYIIYKWGLDYNPLNPKSEEAIEKILEGQNKKMYTEEEVIEILTQRCKALGTENKFFQELLLKQDLEWFENYKKK